MSSIGLKLAFHTCLIRFFQPRTIIINLWHLLLGLESLIIFPQDCIALLTPCRCDIIPTYMHAVAHSLFLLLLFIWDGREIALLVWRQKTCLHCTATVVERFTALAR